jgi:ComEC/Rec2-related protein
MLVGGVEPSSERACLVGALAAMLVAFVPRRGLGCLVLLGFFCLGLIRSGSIVSSTPSIDSEALWDIELIRFKRDARVQLYRVRAAWSVEPHEGSPRLLWVGRFDVSGFGLGPHYLRARTGFRALVAGRIRPARGEFRNDMLMLSPARGVHVFATTKSKLRWRSWIELRVRDLQDQFSTSIDRHAPGELNGLFRALVMGVRGGIDDNMREAFNRTGTAHLLAISGLHIGLLSALVHSLARRFVRSTVWFLRREWVEAGLVEFIPGLCAVGVATCYVLVAGCPTSGLRALGMLVLFFVLRGGGRRFSRWNVLGGAGLAVVLFDPSTLRSPALHLSLVSVASLLLLPRTLGSAAGILSRSLQGLGLASLASLATGLAVAPLSGLLWGRVPIAGLWLNPPVLALLGWGTVPPLLLACFLSLLSEELSRPFFWAASLSASCGLQLVEWGSSNLLSPMVYWQPTNRAVATIYAAAALVVLIVRGTRNLPLPDISEDIPLAERAHGRRDRSR